MNSYTFVNMMTGSHEFHVHLAKCRDLNTSTYRQTNGRWDEVALDVESAVQANVDEFNEQDMGYTADAFKVFPCTTA